MEKWNYEYDVKEIIKSINKYSWYSWAIKSKYCVIDEYLEIFREKVSKQTSSLNDLFKQMENEISRIANGNISHYYDDLENKAIEKIVYIVENHSDYFEDFEPIGESFITLLKRAEFHMMKDLLFKFHNEFKKEFTKELEKENKK